MGRLSHPAASLPAKINTTAQNFFVKRIFLTDLPVSIVVTDANLVLLQNVLQKDISLNDYVGGQYPANILAGNFDPTLRSALNMAATGRYTTIGDLNIAAKCNELAREFGAKTILRYARYINVRDFERGNFVLIGSRRGNPWVSLFEPKLNFLFKEDPQTHAFYFFNKQPQKGEQIAYLSSSDGRGGNISYVDMALLPNLAKNGYVLLFDGAVMESNEAAAQLIFGKLPQSISRVIDSQTHNDLQSIEILLRVHSIEGTASGFDIVGMRTTAQ
jgi:hypothetical protein